MKMHKVVPQTKRRNTKSSPHENIVIKTFPML